MLGWLESLLGFVGGALKTLWDDLINIIRNVDGYLEQRINNIQAQVNALISGEWNLSSYIANFVNGPYTNLVRWTQSRTNALDQQERNDFNRLADGINSTRSWTASLVSAAESLAHLLFGNLTKWIIGAIFGPLSHDIATALGWIGKEGAYLLDIILHPDKLLSLILHFLFGMWIQLLVKWAPVVFAYGLRHWKSMMPTILNVVEEILKVV